MINEQGQARLIPGAANFVTNAIQSVGGGGNSGGGGGGGGGGAGGLRKSAFEFSVFCGTDPLVILYVVYEYILYVHMQ